jgi:hypothetical protein
MGLLTWLLGRRNARPDANVEPEDGMLSAVKPTPTMRPIETPKATPTTQPLSGERRTAGTPSYGAPHGTPSTQRIHNPTRPGR